jgi:hypothetical protein
MSNLLPPILMSCLNEYMKMDQLYISTLINIYYYKQNDIILQHYNCSFWIDIQYKSWNESRKHLTNHIKYNKTSATTQHLLQPINYNCSLCIHIQYKSMIWISKTSIESYKGKTKHQQVLKYMNTSKSKIDDNHNS